MNHNEHFRFTYSAQQQKEVEEIRRKYLPREEDKMEQLRKLHAVPTRKAQSASLVVGITGALILGTGMSLQTLVSAGIPGVILGFMTIIVTGIPTYFLYRLAVPKAKRRGCVAGMAVGTTAGNAVATPAAIALIDPAWEAFAEVATAQVAASVIITAVFVPLIVDRLYKWEEKKGLLNLNVPLAGTAGDAVDEPAL